MQIGMVGLGRMGMNMARRLLQGRHQVIAYNRTPDRVKEIKNWNLYFGHLPQRRAIFTVGRQGQDTSSRWFIMGLNTE